MVKRLPAMWEIWAQPLGWEDPLEKGKVTHSSSVAWRIPCAIHGVSESDLTEWLSLCKLFKYFSVTNSYSPLSNKCTYALLAKFRMYGVCRAL